MLRQRSYCSLKFAELIHVHSTVIFIIRDLGTSLNKINNTLRETHEDLMEVCEHLRLQFFLGMIIDSK